MLLVKPFLLKKRHYMTLAGWGDLAGSKVKFRLVQWSQLGTQAVGGAKAKHKTPILDSI
jgi:hypothetical protein